MQKVVLNNGVEMPILGFGVLWGPFAEGRNNMFQNEVLMSLAQKHRVLTSGTYAERRYIIIRNDRASLKSTIMYPASMRSAPQRKM